MKIVIAPDSFKGSVSSREAADAIERGIKRYLPNAVIHKVPIADGGEGTLDCMLTATGGRKVSVRVEGPLGAPVDAEYGILGDGGTAVIEMAKASGLGLIDAEARDPMLASTYGTGQLIRHALDQGCRSFILAIGGSATNDGGAGMLEALGMRLLDEAGGSVGRGGGSLGRIAAVDDRDWDPRIGACTFMIASDVQNPLIGPTGASHVFGPQKGATPEQAEALDRNMAVWADTVERATGVRLHDRPGAGAAGGIGGALLAFFPSSIERGIDVLIAHTRLREHLDGADLVITGEGRIDAQTASGKTPMGIAQEAKKLGVPAVVLAGTVGGGIEALYEHGVHAVFSIVNGPMQLQEAIDRAAELLELSAEQIVRLLSVGVRR